MCLHVFRSIRLDLHGFGMDVSDLWSWGSGALWRPVAGQNRELWPPYNTINTILHPGLDGWLAGRSAAGFLAGWLYGWTAGWLAGCMV